MVNSVGIRQEGATINKQDPFIRCASSDGRSAIRSVSSAFAATEDEDDTLT